MVKFLLSLFTLFFINAVNAAPVKDQSFSVTVQNNLKKTKINNTCGGPYRYTQNLRVFRSSTKQELDKGAGAISPAKPVTLTVQYYSPPIQPNENLMVTYSQTCVGYDNEYNVCQKGIVFPVKNKQGQWLSTITITDDGANSASCSATYGN